MLKKMLLLIFIAISLSSAAYAANVGDEIGRIYSTDILADVNGAAINSYALDGKTAIVVEDLARYGFTVGYSDECRTLYAYVKSNTYNPVPDNTRRGKAGEILGSIYATDIKTVINGREVPSFALDGVTAVAIEDIAADITCETFSETTMMYRWDSEKRTVSLLPAYDNAVQAQIIFAGYGACPYIKDGVLNIEANRASRYGLPSDNMTGAFKKPIRWKTSDGEIIGYAYDSYITEPVLANDGVWHIENCERYIVNFDIERIYQIAEEEAPEALSYEETLTREEKLLESDEKTEKHESENGAILRNKCKITVISKNSENGQCTAIRGEGVECPNILSNYVFYAPSYSISDYQYKNTAMNDDISSFMFEFENASGDRYVQEVYYSGFSYRFTGALENSSLGEIYMWNALSDESARIFGSGTADFYLDGVKQSGVRFLRKGDFFGETCIAAEDAARIFGGSVEIADKNSLKLTTDKQAHAKLTYKIIGDGDYGTVKTKKIYSNRSDNYNDKGEYYDFEGKLFIDEKRAALTVERTVSTAGMSFRDVTISTPIYLYDNILYIPLGVVSKALNIEIWQE